MGLLSTGGWYSGINLSCIIENVSICTTDNEAVITSLREHEFALWCIQIVETFTTTNNSKAWQTYYTNLDTLIGQKSRKHNKLHAEPQLLFLYDYVPQ